MEIADSRWRFSAEEAHFNQLHQQFHKKSLENGGPKWLVKVFELQNFKGFAGKEYTYI